MEHNEERAVVTDRTVELLQHTSSSVSVHLEQAEGWLKLANIPGEPDFWRVDAVTGPIGNLADVCGRLTLLARVTGSESEVSGDLDAIMHGLVGLLQRLLSGDIAKDEVETLRQLLAQARRVYERAVLQNLPTE